MFHVDKLVIEKLRKEYMMSKKIIMFSDPLTRGDLDSLHKTLISCSQHIQNNHISRWSLYDEKPIASPSMSNKSPNDYFESTRTLGESIHQSLKTNHFLYTWLLRIPILLKLPPSKFVLIEFGAHQFPDWVTANDWKFSPEVNRFLSMLKYHNKLPFADYWAYDPSHTGQEHQIMGCLSCLKDEPYPGITKADLLHLVLQRTLGSYNDAQQLINNTLRQGNIPIIFSRNTVHLSTYYLSSDRFAELPGVQLHTLQAIECLTKEEQTKLFKDQPLSTCNRPSSIRYPTQHAPVEYLVEEEWQPNNFVGYLWVNASQGSY